MNDYHNSPIGKVPPEWSTELIGNFFDIQQGKQLSVATRKGDNVKKFLRTSNISWGRIDLDNLDQMHFSENDAARMDLKENDLLVCEGGDIGRTAICKFDLPEVYYQNHLHRLRPKNNEVIPEFFMYWMWYVWNLTDHYGGAGNKTTIPNLSKAKLSGLHFAKPSTDEQKNIAFILSTLQKAIQKHEEIIITTTALKKSLLNKLFTEGTKGETLKQTKIGMIPASWEVVPLGKYAFIENGFAFKSADYVKSGIPLIRISNVSHGSLIDKDPVFLPESYLLEYEKYSLKEGDLIISLTRPVTSGGLKYCFIKEEHLPALLNQRVGRFQIRNSGKLLKSFLYHLVFSQYFVGELEKLFGSSSQQPNVSPNQLENFSIPIPSPEEQSYIAQILFSLNNKIDVAERKCNLYRQLFNSLLNELMTGSIRVNHLNFSYSNTSSDASPKTVPA